MNIPLLADKTAEIAKAYGVYKEDAGRLVLYLYPYTTFRYYFNTCKSVLKIFLYHKDIRASNRAAAFVKINQ